MSCQLLPTRFVAEQFNLTTHYSVSTMQFQDFGRDIVTHSDIVRTLGPIAANKEADLANSGLASQFESNVHW